MWKNNVQAPPAPQRRAKFKVALEPAKGVRTVNEIATEFGIHPNLVNQWKQAFLKGGDRSERASEALQAELYEQFGRLKMELEWLKYVVAWQLSNTLDGQNCREALEVSLQRGHPDIFNTDQRVQFTATEFTRTLEQVGIRISMDGRGRALDNIFVERSWCTVKYENV